MQYLDLPEKGVDMMVDLETLGTKTGSPVLSIGACRFDTASDTFAVIDDFYVEIDLQSSLDLGMRPSADTIKWWMRQSTMAQTIFSMPGQLKVADALGQFIEYMGARPDKLWGNSNRFDLGLLETAYTLIGHDAPWRHWLERDYRTVKNLAKAQDVVLERSGTHHNALDDAVTQSRHLHAIFKALQL